MGVKVITPPVIADLISVANARTHLRLASDGTQDGLLTTYLAAAHAKAEHYTNRPIGEQTRELALDEFPCGAIDLGEGVTAITSITYVDTDGNEATVSTSDYTLDDYSTPCWAVPGLDVTWPSTAAVANAVKVRFVCGGDAKATAAVSPILRMTAWQMEKRGDEAGQDMVEAAGAAGSLDTIRVYVA